MPVSGLLVEMSRAWRQAGSDRSIERSLKMVEILCDVQAIGESVMDMNRDGHGAAHALFGDLAKRDSGRGIGLLELPRMRD